MKGVFAVILLSVYTNPAISVVFDYNIAFSWDLPFYVRPYAVRRRRRLAGHLFQDRWKDQGRGFILLPPWPPNCLGQMLTVRDFSQHLVSSSKTIRPNIPRGARCMGHSEMM